MSAEAMAAVWQRLDREPPQFFADELDPEFRRAAAIRGWLREVPRGKFAACPGCPTGRIARVEWFEATERVPASAYVACRLCGPVAIEPASLGRWCLEVPALLSSVATASGGKGPPADLCNGRVWYLGSAAWGGRAREVVFARNVVRTHSANVRTVVAKRPKAVLLVPTRESADTWLGTVPNAVVPLSEVSGWSESGPFVDGDRIAGILLDAGFEATPSRPKRPKRRSERAEGIDRLRRAWKEHLIRAREYALAMRDSTGIPQLLPPPTQKSLADELGMTESQVSRCTADAAAVELRLLARTAKDIDEILRWKPR